MATDDGPLRGERRTLLVLLAVTALSLALRLYQLGGRVMHWDEGRVGYWILRFDETGVIFYRPIIHGPFIQIVNGWVFDFLPPTDANARLVVALVGGLLPLSAWLLREHLRDDEQVALALLLALNPVLVYYSRFMRNDVLVGAFSFVALALVVRAIDTRDVGYLYQAALFEAFAFSSKENVLVYVLCFVGAGVLLFDHRLVRSVSAGTSVGTALRTDGGVVANELDRLSNGFGPLRWVALHVVGVLGVFFAVVAFFYAPRPDLWQAVADPALLPGVVEEALLGSWNKFADLWGSDAHRDHTYLPYLWHMFRTLFVGGAVVLVFAVLGYIVDGYVSARSRAIVAFASYWGAASLLGYPAATDIKAGWAAVHVVLPLTIPAAVGVAYVYRSGRAAGASKDFVGVALAAVLLVAAVAVPMAGNVTYWNAAGESTTDTEDPMIQWAQPSNDLQSTMQKVERVSETNRGTDVLFFSTCNPSGGCDPNDRGDMLLYVDDESSLQTPPPGGPAWHDRLPLPWYLERAGADVTSSHPNRTAEEVVGDGAPPVVIAMDWNRSDLEPHLQGYEVHEHKFRVTSYRVVVFIDRDALREANREKAAREAERPNASLGRPARAAEPWRHRAAPSAG